MIRKVKISNFKSVQELELDLGRLNVFIGENGCGKTSILEGIALGGAAANNKLDEEFFVARGIRVTGPPMMKSAFRRETRSKPIEVQLDEEYFRIDKQYSDAGILDSKWMVSDSEGYYASRILVDAYQDIIHLLEESADDDIKSRTLLSTIQREFYSAKSQLELGRSIPELPGFLIFAPENFFLRRFEEDGQVRPLGIRGEGLFRHLVELSKEEPETFKAISDQLSLIDWFDGLSIPNDLHFTERRIAITDRYIADAIKEFDQRSANEGFLFLLFYFTLFLSKYTPKFFAIDNIDNALNPRLCSKLVEVLAKLSKEHDKQAILTTHNPAILDGLDLTDDEQRLFVIYRNADGETNARRVKPLQPVNGVEPVRLSEAFVRGYLGGLPKNF